jgi:hypothetical protein
VAGLVKVERPTGRPTLTRTATPQGTMAAGRVVPVPHPCDGLVLVLAARSCRPARVLALVVVRRQVSLVARPWLVLVGREAQPGGWQPRRRERQREAPGRAAGPAP